jgi:hypothetical protein
MRVIGIVFGTILILSSLLMLAPYSKGDLGNLADGPIMVDEHWIDIFQQADKNTLGIDEFIFINNTGDEPFSGDIYIWVDDDAEIIAKCCGNAPNMACRFQTDGAMACFNFAEEENNIFKGAPFYSNDLISFYNQKEWLKINAYSQENSSIARSLNLNISLNQPSKLREPESVSDIGPLFFTSDYDVIGIDIQLSEYMPNNMTVLENLQIKNNATDSVTLDLTIEGIPTGWSALILNNSESIEDITLSPFEEVNLTLKLTVPSHIAPIKVSYTKNINNDGGDNTKRTFAKTYLYNSRRVEYFIFALSDKGVSVSNDLQFAHPTAEGEPELNEEYNRFWYVAQSFNILADSKSTITLEWENSQDPISIMLILLLIVIIALLIGVPLLRRRSNLAKTRNDEGEESSSGTTYEPEVIESSDFEKEKDKIHNVPEKTGSKGEGSAKKRVQNLTFVLTKLKDDHENGLLPDETYNELEDKYKNELSQAEEALKKENDIDSKKQRFARAIKRLEDDHENGRLDDDTFNSLIKEYKKARDDHLKEN